MGCLYKNFFKRTILNEVNEVFGTDPVEQHKEEIHYTTVVQHDLNNTANDVFTLHEPELLLSDDDSVAATDPLSQV